MGDWNALAAAVRARRAELRRQQDLRSRGGPGPMTVRRVENGEQSFLRGHTKNQLEAGLDWPHGHIDRVLEGEPLEARPVASFDAFDLNTLRRVGAFIQAEIVRLETQDIP